MAATARLVVQMTPKEKKALDGRAKQAGLSTAESSVGGSIPTTLTSIAKRSKPC